MNFNNLMIALLNGNPTIDNYNYTMDYCLQSEEQQRLNCRLWLVDRKEREMFDDFDKLAMFNMILTTAYNHLDPFSAEVFGFIWSNNNEPGESGLTELDTYIMNLKSDLTKLLILPA